MLHGEKAYDASALQHVRRARGITPCLVRRGSTPPSGLADTTGWSSARERGCSAAAASASAPSDEPTCSRGCSI